MEESSVSWEEELEAGPVPAPVPMPPPMQPAPTSNTTSYESVYCGDTEGKLEVSDDGLVFSPYGPYVPDPNNATPHTISWRDVTLKEFVQEDVKAGYQSYSTMLTFYNLRMGVVPSREVIFSFRQPDEYDRFQCDLDARGHGAPPPKEKDVQSVSGVFHPDDYDHMAADEEAHDTEVNWQDERDNNNDIDDDDDDFNGPERENWRQSETERTEEDFARGWSTQDTTSMPNSSYYPVRCKNNVGSLVLSRKHLQFVPDRHSATVKTLPWAAFAGKPFYSPWNYPRAQVTIHYYTTQGPGKKVGFDLESHNVLVGLEEDIRARMRPFKNAPREKVPVAPKRDDSSRSTPSVSRPQGGGGSVKKPKSYKKSKVTPADTSHTEETTSYGVEERITPASAPLVATTARRVPYHQDEPRRRLFLLFMSYCCIATLTGLTFSILFGYFFGPRRPREEYIRTQSPYDISADYLGSKPPTVAPNQSELDSWNSEAITMSRTVTDAPEVVASGSMNKEISEQRGGGMTEQQSSGSFRGSALDLVTMAPAVVPAGHSPTGIAPTTITPTSLAPTSSAPTMTPTTLTPTLTPTMQETRSSKSIVEVLMAKSHDHGQALRTPGTPQQAAYLLMKVSGLLDNTLSDSAVVQKYALATLYYATGGQDWKDGSATWKDLLGSDCLKTDIQCDEATKDALWIDMPHNNMHGSLPPEIGLLSKLTHINFKDNALEGMIPTELGLLSELKVLDLSGNKKLEGGVPDEVKSLPSLTEVKTDLP